MKLALICTEKLPSPAVKGGAIQMMIDGVTPFLAEYYQLTIFSIEDENLPKSERKNKVTYLRFPRENYRKWVAETLSQHHFDLIHVFNRPVNVPLYKKASPTSKIFLSLHNDMFTNKKISYELGKRVIDNVTGMMTVSNYIKEQIVHRFPDAEEKTRVVYSGVDLLLYQEKEDFRHKYQLENKKILLFVGRLSKSKGPHLLIEAMKDVAVDYPDAVLVIVGGKWFSDNSINEYVAFLHELAQPLGDKVLFTGHIPVDEISNFFLMADVCLCSSQWNEPLARVHYEAMAAGKPLITTKRGGNGEIVFHKFNGLIVEDYQSPFSFASAIKEVFSQPETAKWLGDNGRAFVERNFTFRHVANRLHKVYQTGWGNGTDRASLFTKLEQ